VQLADGRLRQASRQVGHIPQLLDEAKANLRLRIEHQEQQEQLRKKQIAVEEEYQRYWEENGEPHPDAPAL
jgi:hypothetical protein